VFFSTQTHDLLFITASNRRTEQRPPHAFVLSSPATFLPRNTQTHFSCSLPATKCGFGSKPSPSIRLPIAAKRAGFQTSPVTLRGAGVTLRRPHSLPPSTSRADGRSGARWRPIAGQSAFPRQKSIPLIALHILRRNHLSGPSGTDAHFGHLRTRYSTCGRSLNSLIAISRGAFLCVAVRNIRLDVPICRQRTAAR